MKLAKCNALLRAMRVIAGRLVVLLLILWGGTLTPAGVRLREWLAAGDLAVQNGQPELAQKYYASLVEMVPASSPAVFERLVSLSLDAKEFSLAQVYLYALVDRVGWTASRYEQLRFIHDHTGQSEMKQALVYASLDRSDDDPGTLRQVAEQQIQQQAWLELAVTLEQWLAVEQENSNALYWQGLLLAPSDPAQAARILARATTDAVWEPRASKVRDALAAYDMMPMTEAHTRVGVVLVGLEEWAFAERMMQLALDANAINPTALGYLGLARDQQGRDGLPVLLDALALAPNDPLLRYLEGVHMRYKGDEQAAFDAFSQAYWLDPSNPALAAEAALSLQHLSDLDEAEYWYRQAVTLAPGDVRWVRLLAAFYADTGFKLDGPGLEFVEEASAHAVDDANLQISLGWAYHQIGKTEQALTILSDALVQNPQDWRGWTYLGMVFEQRGDSQAALAAYDMVLLSEDSEISYRLLASRAVERLSSMAP